MAAITSSLLSTSISLHNRQALPNLHFINPKPLQQGPKSLPQRSDCSRALIPRAIGKALKSVIPFLDKDDPQKVKAQLLLTIAKLGRGAEASPQDQLEVERICSKLEALSPTKEPLRSPFLNGKWELVYTTSTSILKTNRPKFLRPNGPIYQAINADTLRAQNIETWPYFNQVTANLVPLNPKKIAVKFDYFKLGGLISIKAPEGARGELEITYLDETLRISRGDKGNLFVLQMVDRSYRIPLSE